MQFPILVLVIWKPTTAKAIILLLAPMVSTGQGSCRISNHTNNLLRNFDDTVDEYSVKVYAFLEATPIKDVVCDEFMHANVH